MHSTITLGSSVHFCQVSITYGGYNKEEYSFLGILDESKCRAMLSALKYCFKLAELKISRFLQETQFNKRSRLKLISCFFIIYNSTQKFLRKCTNSLTFLKIIDSCDSNLNVTSQIKIIYLHKSRYESYRGEYNMKNKLSYKAKFIMEN